MPATLIVPDGKGPFPGIVLMHGMPSDRKAMLPAGDLLSRMGAAVILIDAPFARPRNAGRDPLTLSAQDREEQIQLIVDLRRAVDILLERPEVDRERLAYYGVSYGGAMGGLLAGVEDRLVAYVLVVGDGGLVTHSTGSEDWPDGELFRLPEARRQAWLEAMWPVEPLHYVGQAAPAALLFQNGTQDALVPAAGALVYQAAGSEPKTVLWYEAGHGLPPEAMRDAVDWLGPFLAAGDLLLVDATFQPAAVAVDRLLLAWLFLVCASLLILLWDLVRARRETWATGLCWVVASLFFGPLALPAYLLVARRPAGGKGLTVPQRAFGSALWGASRAMIGGILALAILLALPAEQRDAPLVRLSLVALLPLATGLLIYAGVQWAGRERGACPLHARRPFLTEAATIVAFLLVAYTVVDWLGKVWMARWYPFGADLLNPAQWAVLILAAWAGAVVLYPLHLWLLAKGHLQWGP